MLLDWPGMGFATGEMFRGFGGGDESFRGVEGLLGGADAMGEGFG